MKAQKGVNFIMMIYFSLSHMQDKEIQIKEQLDMLEEVKAAVAEFFKRTGCFETMRVQIYEQTSSASVWQAV